MPYVSYFVYVMSNFVFFTEKNTSLMWIAIRQIALLVGIVIVAAGLAYMKSKKSKKKGGSRKKLTVATTSSSPKARKKIATGIGSVQTPSGRRSARIARKST